MFSYEHYDVNRRIRRPIKLHKINTINLCNDLENLATEISNEINNGNHLDNDRLNHRLTNGIYKACHNNKKERSKQDTERMPNNQHCSSKHYKAIAEANYFSYQHHLSVNNKAPEAKHYRNQWLRYHDKANEKEQEEYKTRINGHAAQMILKSYGS